MTEDDRFVMPKELARTYDSGYYEDAADILEQYDRATEYARKHDAGSSATASALDLPRSRLRTWIDDGGKPDPVHAVHTAIDYGWCEVEYDDPEFTALNTLVANVFSGGSIANHHYRPSFALNHRGADSHVIDALELSGAPYEVVERDPDRADEARPTDDGTVLGRVLAVLGAPVGPKAEQHLELPSYLEDAPAEVRETFVYAYLENRATEHEGKDTLHIQEERNQDYLVALANLLADVADGEVSVGDRHIVISADAARNLGTVR
ncbi:hypothetical protein SAMN05444422_11350 [Halobiforma haloterrestris]|uniref:Uncharacterized protein n=1 Tax=Natronobacterium haloterrestre TaxID=148448 RepID=A0A1I1KX69_NATHA|nr:hypothetical protein [Halobiforma haloterrestris]SFC65394.1 hypothetical protein SAMN05444422_11350 [Halobiforma haloterrestris]